MVSVVVTFEVVVCLLGIHTDKQPNTMIPITAQMIVALCDIRIL